MFSLQIKAFLGHKRSISEWDGADRLSIDTTGMRFAVSDGVSKSFLPNIWAHILCHTYTTEKTGNDVDWLNNYVTNLLSADAKKWQTAAEAVMASAPPEKAFRLTRARKQYNVAAATLVGIAIENDTVHYDVIGDSCLFVFSKQSGELVTFSTVDEANGFTNTTDCIVSNGQVAGGWKQGQFLLQEGFILLMTDALSDWFLRAYQKDTSIIDRLWFLDSHEQFMTLVENERDKFDEERQTFSLKDDDVALLMLKVEVGGNGVAEILFIDKLKNDFYPEWVSKQEDMILSEFTQPQDPMVVEYVPTTMEHETVEEKTEIVKEEYHEDPFNQPDKKTIDTIPDGTTDGSSVETAFSDKTDSASSDGTGDDSLTTKDGVCTEENNDKEKKSGRLKVWVTSLLVKALCHINKLPYEKIMSTIYKNNKEDAS